MGAEKPEPKLFNWALERLGASGPESAMVGDSIKRDMAGARNLGMQGVLLWGDHFARSAPPAGCEDLLVLKNLGELPLKLAAVEALSL